MGDIRKLEPLTDWLAFELDPTPLLSEPVIRLRLRYLDTLDSADEYVRFTLRSVPSSIALANRAIVEWDLTENGVPIPVNDATKAKYLRPFLGLHIALTAEEKAAVQAIEDALKEGKPYDGPAEPTRSTLVKAVVEAAMDIDNFLKN